MEANSKAKKNRLKRVLLLLLGSSWYLHVVI